ncbi:hypothetical protein [Polynucleobacter paneuropaeus]|uniref:hypothetical protein n=1 Tax=Polynucleobacter paneuropaeus TaxID=2527775 RepID=UPI001BFD6A78|nr:hypothetical protein [Polynucleobacter paneuropaeus]QWD51302.1 hypothetical protein C2753_01675 [Polynucleobacter paneuropaeus]
MRNYFENKKIINYYIIFFCVLIFVYNIYLLEIFVNGDQSSYILFYESIQFSSPFNLIDAGLRDIQTVEPGYLVVAYIASNLFIPKIIFSAMLSSFFAGTFLLIFNRLRLKHIILLSSLICFGYYFLVIFTDLERLKLALIFLFLAIYYSGRNNKILIILLILSILTHFQILIILFGIFLIGAFKKFKLSSELLNYKFSFNYILILTLTLTLTLIYLFYDHLYYKILFYTGQYNFENLLYSLIFVLFFSFLINDKTNYYICVLPSLIAVLLFSGGRVNMLIFFITVYFVCKNSKNSSLGLILLSLFSIGKTIMLLPSALYAGRWVF